MTRFVVGDDRSQSTLFPERLPDGPGTGRFRYWYGTGRRSAPAGTVPVPYQYPTSTVTDPEIRNYAP
jgi:hypothetical protein